jgi:hypothetical protein
MLTGNCQADLEEQKQKLSQGYEELYQLMKQEVVRRDEKLQEFEYV